MEGRDSKEEIYVVSTLISSSSSRKFNGQNVACKGIDKAYGTVRTSSSRWSHSMRSAWSLGASRRRHSKEFRRDLPRVVICSQRTWRRERRRKGKEG